MHVFRRHACIPHACMEIPKPACILYACISAAENSSCENPAALGVFFVHPFLYTIGVAREGVSKPTTAPLKIGG